MVALIPNRGNANLEDGECATCGSPMTRMLPIGQQGDQDMSVQVCEGRCGFISLPCVNTEVSENPAACPVVVKLAPPDMPDDATTNLTFSPDSQPLIRDFIFDFKRDF